MHKKAVIVVILLMFVFSGAEACTLWGANGDDYVKDGGSLLAKNRDWAPDHKQTLKVIIPSDGYRFIGLIADGKQGGVKAGINEFGLAVVSSSAGTIPLNVRQQLGHYKGGTMSAILKHCRSVDEVLEHSEYFLGVQNIMVADKNKIVRIEIAPEGVYSVKTTVNGVIYQTNHYVDEGMEIYNYRTPGISSLTRYARIAELLKPDHQYSLDDFIAISQDRAAGADNSLWRTGSTPKVPRTLATWIVHIVPEGSPKLYVKLANPGEEEYIYNIDVSEIFENLSSAHKD